MTFEDLVKDNAFAATPCAIEKAMFNAYELGFKDGRNHHGSDGLNEVMMELKKKIESV